MAGNEPREEALAIIIRQNRICPPIHLHALPEDDSVFLCLLMMMIVIQSVGKYLYGELGN